MSKLEKLGLIATPETVAHVEEFIANMPSPEKGQASIAIYMMWNFMVDRLDEQSLKSTIEGVDRQLLLKAQDFIRRHHWLDNYPAKGLWSTKESGELFDDIHERLEEIRKQESEQG